MQNCGSARWWVAAVAATCKLPPCLPRAVVGKAVWRGTMCIPPLSAAQQEAKWHGAAWKFWLIKYVKLIRLVKYQISEILWYIGIE